METKTPAAKNIGNGVTAFKDPDTGKVKTDPAQISKEMAVEILRETIGLFGIATRGITNKHAKKRLTKLRRLLWGIIRTLEKA